MKPEELWHNGWLVKGCLAGACFWLVPTHGRPEHYTGTLESGIAMAKKRERPKAPAWMK